MLTDIEYEMLAPVRDAPPGLRAQRVAQAAALLGCSVPTVYRKLGKAGFDSKRKRRSDAGECMLTVDELRLVSGVLLASTNQKAQRMPVATALDMLRASGALHSAASEGTVSRQLYAHMLHPEQLSMPTQAVRLTSEHPNHVWQVDSTTGAYYYLPGGRLRWMDEDEFNKNKVANLVKASTDLLTRYAAADHTSHAMKVRYCLGGESAHNLLEFLVWAICKQASSPLHGVPHILMADQGPANKSHLMTAFCERLGIRLMLHAPGNARATGSVEKAHDLARMHLETRYHFQEPAKVTLDKLNTDAESWAAAYCSNRVHTRHGRTRYGCWMEIARFPGALRTAASEEALRDAATSRPEQARVDNTKRISHRGIPYNLELVPGAIAGMKVTVQRNVYRAPAIDVQVVDTDTGEVSWHVVEPEQLNEFGFDGRNVIGAGYKAVPHSVLDTNRASLKQQAYKTGDGLPTQAEADKARKAHAAAYVGVVEPMADVAATQVPAYLPRAATTIALPERRVQAQRLTVVDACKRIKARIGAAYTPQTFSDLAARYADGVPEDQIDALCDEFAAPPAAADDATRLRLIGGGAA